VILVDTSVWIDHLRAGEGGLSELLNSGAVLAHPWVIGEVALGSLRSRDEVIGLLRGLPPAIVADDDEVLRLINEEALHGTGIGYVDAQLLAATRLTPGARLWTRDKRLRAAALRLGLGFELAPHRDSGPGADEPEHASTPEEVGHLFLQHLNGGDADGLAGLYEAGAVLAAPAGQLTTGGEAIRRLYEQMLADRPSFEEGEHQLPLRAGDLALSSTRLVDGKVTAEVLRRQDDGTWLMAIDQSALCSPDS
jgi:predicted nucleic acid-binding protein/ketosteroid isomerase-like protein